MKIVALPLLSVCFLLAINMSFAQQDPFIKDFMERLDNSQKYLLEMAKAMPADKYTYRASVDEMTFAEQLTHIAAGIDWHGQTLIMGRKERSEHDSTFIAAGKTKQQIIDLIEKTYKETSTGLRKFSRSHLDDRVAYFNKNRSKRQIFMLLSDHITHHRAQLVVYLRLNGIPPPEYINYQ